MGQIGQADNPLSEVTVRRSKRARRMTLRVSRLDGRVTLTLPRGVSEREAAGFVREKADWIANAQGSVADEAVVKVGGEILIEGRPWAIVEGLSRQAVLGEDVVEAPVVKTGEAVAKTLKKLARKRISSLAHQHAAQLDRSVGKITLRDTRSRWGSCSYEGNLMLSWRLIMAPPEVLDYVIAHEVAHLVEMNHSSAFWALTERLCPDFRQHKAWLRQEGTALHRYRFDDGGTPC